MILAKTVKGYGMGKAGEALNVTHQQKKMDDEALKAFRDRFNIPVTDDEIARVPFFRPAEDSAEMQYLKGHRKSLGGSLPVRRTNAPALVVPALEAFKNLLDGSEGREISTTMVFVRILTQLLKDKHIGAHVVPIVPDEARTFGMEGLFRQVGIYSSVGQLYTPQDADQLMYYREDQQGPDAGGGHQRGGRVLLVDGGRDGLREPRNQHDSDVHLLFDVRLPAHRRLRLGGGRHAGARLPAGRDGGTHDARGRGPAAPGRPQPPARVHDPELRRLRPVLRL